MAEQLIHGLAWLATHDYSAQQKPSHAFIALDAIGPQGSGSIQAQGLGVARAMVEQLLYPAPPGLVLLVAAYKQV